MSGLGPRWRPRSHFEMSSRAAMRWRSRSRPHLSRSREMPVSWNADLRDHRWMQLRDEKLFRQRCYIDGAWVAAAPSDSTSTIPRPGTSGRAAPGRGDTRSDRRRRARFRVARQDREGARGRAAPLVRPDDANHDDLALLMTREQGKPIAESRGEVAYAASLLEWFGEEAQARLRRHHPGAPGRQAHRRHQGADRRRRAASRRGISRSR